MSLDSAMVSLLTRASVVAVVLAALAWAFLLVFGVRRADVRHAVWSMVLIAMLAAPLVGWLAPPLTLRIGHAPAAPDATPALQFPLEVRATAPGAHGSPTVRPWIQRHWQPVVCALYAAGALFMMGRFSYGHALALKLGRASKPVEVAVAARTPVRETDCITVPVTIGWLKPRILLPVDWREWSDGKLRAVVAHESTHVRRGDYLVSILASLNRAIFWFHPLAWWLERTLINYAEQASDDEALGLTGDREQYAGALLDMAAAVRAGRGRLVWEAMAMARPNEVRRRIELVLDETRRLAPGLSKARWAALALACVPLAYSAAAVRFEEPEAPRKPEVILQGEYLMNLVAGNQLTAAQAEEIEARLRQIPEDLEARGKLIAYYFMNGIRQPRLNHIFWLIEHHPESEVSRLYSMAITPGKSILNDETDFDRAQTLWREQARRHSDNPQVLSNAADFFSSTGSDLELAIDLYKRSLVGGRPDSFLPRQMLAALYSRILIATLKTDASAINEPFRNPALAEKIRQEVESASDGFLLTSVASALRSVAVPAGMYPSGVSHPPLREEHPELAPVFEYGDRLWKRAKDLGLVMMPHPLDVKHTWNAPPVPGSAPQPKRIRVGGNVQAAMLVKRVQPVYPQWASAARIIGIVKLSVVISTEGKILQIQVNSGHPIFIPAAMEAAKQWEYKPTMLEGKAVEVATTVDLFFSPATAALPAAIPQIGLTPPASSSPAPLAARPAESAGGAGQFNYFTLHSDPPDKPRRVRVGGGVQQFKLQKHVDPVYSREALAARITGTVKLGVVLSTEGKVQQIRLVSGHPLLAPAAIKAVKQWEYRPTLLSGKPVEVVTVVDVVFDLPPSR